MTIHTSSKTWLAGIAAVTAIAISACDSEGASEVSLSYAFFAPAGSFPGKQMEHWAEQIQERTDGQVSVETYPAGTLLSARDMYNGVERGVADIGLGSPAEDPGRFPVSALFNLPLGFENATAASLTYWDVIQEIQPSEFDGYRIIALFTSEPARIQSRNPVTGLGDLERMTIASNGSITRTTDALGANPVGMLMPQVAEAFPTGVIDGVATSREVLHDFKIAEYANYVTEYPLGVVTFAAVMSEERWQQLPGNVQDEIESLGREMALWTGKTHDEGVADAVSWSESNHDLETITLSDDEHRAWKERIDPLIQNWKEDAEERGLAAERVLEVLRELQAEHASEHQ